MRIILTKLKQCVHCDHSSPEAAETAEDAEAEQLEEAEQQEAADDEARDEVDGDALGSQSEVSTVVT